MGIVGRIISVNVGVSRDVDWNHGGPEKALYAYPSEHYEYWRMKFGHGFPWGMFGENLKIQELLEIAGVAK